MTSAVRDRCVVLLVLTLAGCQQMHASQGLLETTAPKSGLSSAKLRTLLNDFVPRFSDQVEEAADRMLAESTDPNIQRNALLWKSNSISACFQAASRTDPLAAYLDVWVLNQQMIQLFEAPSQSPLFGNWQNLAVQTSRQLEQLLRDIDAKLGSEMPLGEEFVVAFAREFPVHSLYFDRESLAGRYIAQIDEPTRELMQVVANLDETLSEMHKLSARYAELLPKQARWQAELLLLSTTQRPIVTQPLQHLSTATQAIDRIARTAELTPDLVGREREALRLIVAHERVETLRDLERMRTQTLQQVSEERIAVLNALRDERVAITNSIGEATDHSLEKIDGLLGRRGTQVAQAGNELLDTIFIRALLVATLCGVFLYLITLARSSGRRRTNSSTGLPNQAPRRAA